MLGDDAALNFSGTAINRGGATVNVFSHGGYRFGGRGGVAGVVRCEHFALPRHGALAGRFDQQLGTALAQSINTLYQHRRSND